MHLFIILLFAVAGSLTISITSIRKPVATNLKPRRALNTLRKKFNVVYSKLTEKILFVAQQYASCQKDWAKVAAVYDKLGDEFNKSVVNKIYYETMFNKLTDLDMAMFILNRKLVEAKSKNASSSFAGNFEKYLERISMRISNAEFSEQFSYDLDLTHWGSNGRKGRMPGRVGNNRLAHWDIPALLSDLRNWNPLHENRK